MTKTPLERWIAGKIGLAGDEVLTIDRLRAYQLAKLGETIRYAGERSPFYRRRLADFLNSPLEELQDIARLPFTTPEDIAESPLQFLCVSQSDIERVITLLVPDMEGPPRRVFFSAEDIELTVDFFRHGMSTLVSPGCKALIFMPGSRPASVGDLLVKALDRMDVEGMVYGLVQDPTDAIDAILRTKADCLVGVPTQILAAARHERAREIPPGMVTSVLLSADYVPPGIVETLRNSWGCEVFSHYGTAEMGLGGGVECEAREGYHLREADLFVEIIEPSSGRPLPPGSIGEVVFTTLTRTGMPLIRYRTGDIAGFMTVPCPCGSVLTRLGKVRGRLRDMIRLVTGDWLGIHDLDEVLFRLPEIVNYTAKVTTARGADWLELTVTTKHGSAVPDRLTLESALRSAPQVNAALETGRFHVRPPIVAETNPVIGTAQKRSISRGSSI